MFPDVPSNEVKRVLRLGWRNFYIYNSYGCDVLVKGHTFAAYCGTYMKDSLKYFEYYKKKMSKRIRMLAIKKKLPWDGYYYFTRYKNQYQEYKDQINSRGRKRKYFKFKNVFMYKYKDDCMLKDSTASALFRIPVPLDMGIFWYQKEIVTDKAEFIEERKPYKMKDLLWNNYTYDVAKKQKHIHGRACDGLNT